ncbi:hypothetical protein, partial [Bradyrhizobium sp. 179]|uniref:hypothetical protein n=1 Tax=Bradyrhizobium sp. 179 TaxID=2782648 RepID=UPI001FFB4686
ADLIEASGHVPRAKAGHMTAPSQCVNRLKKLLPRGPLHIWGARSLEVGGHDETAVRWVFVNVYLPSSGPAFQTGRPPSDLG